MTPAKKTIRLTSVICIITFILTFLICLNISYACFELKWLSNTFQVTIAGGIFASSAVVLLCEVQKYRMSKRSIEDSLWSNTTLLYVKITVVKHKLENLMQCPNQPVSAGFFDDSAVEILNFSRWINAIDYAPYKNNPLKKGVAKFQREDGLSIMGWAQEFSAFNIAVNMSDIEMRKNNLLQIQVVTAANPIVARTTAILYDKVNQMLSFIEELLKSIDYSGRYDCKKMLTTVKEKTNDLTDFDFQKFLNQN